MTSRAPATELSRDEARHIAIAAALPADGFPTVSAALAHLHIVQLDGISTLARAHQLTLTARVPGATTATVDASLNSTPATAFDYLAHALSLVPIADWPLWAFRRRASRKRPHYPAPQVRKALLDQITREGPLPIRRLRGATESGAGWDWGPTKTAVEMLLWAGELASTRRDGARRLFDLTERCIPAEHLTDQISDDACLSQLLGHAGRALGVATADDLADYLRIPTPVTARLLPATRLTPVRVAGWEPAWADPDALARTPQPRRDPVFLGPFDNLIWHRPRVQRLFGFTQVLEAYKPVARRQHGYYVCPLLADGRLIGRADLARRGETLTILQAGLEPGPGPDAAHHFAHACRTLAAATGRSHLAFDTDATDPATAATLKSALDDVL
ncbi:winged helix-turn-helix domain-containing protein [Streptomyces anulatus]|uniref:winged helix-turn-helix domain-containing protein n=1 Tax=Streptomyces anulatus TaxID=1892 RepID=UPI0036FCA90A